MDSVPFSIFHTTPRTGGGAALTAKGPPRILSAIMTTIPAPNPAPNPDGLIAFQGELGAYSHAACRAAYPAMEPLPCPTFEDAFAAVREGRARYAMIPIDNSLNDSSSVKYFSFSKSK